MTFYKDLKDQQLLLPPNIRDLIPRNHICYLVDKIIQNMDLTDIEKDTREQDTLHIIRR
ncbi:hypothetical protein [Candidatus Methanoperedens nitratireducens]|uniref:Transposase n=1 Tax=Candidatus Methanoperedens nitratireducens TaxID=1392998 RepID=A0A284VMD9_9EURY|nr:hypothetical protein [Candidatus Methanoperedens nitroreducens]SNQ60412.1 hypothetical protein MNV_180044 [Candidatus Methanoperedens nitroreducens]